MITHTSDSHQNPSQNKTKLQILKKIAKNSNFEILQKTLHTTHLLKLFDKMYNMKWIQPELYALQSGCRTDGWTDGRSETNIPPQQLHSDPWTN